MAWFDTDWLKRKRIDVSASIADAALTDFPVMVPLDDDIMSGARPDLRDVLFTAADEVTQLSHELVKHSFVGLGTWTWFNSPRAVFHNGTHRRTYTGGMHGSNVQAYAIDHDDRAVTGGTVTASLETDDHDNPGIVVRASDSKLAYFYAKHSADATLRYKVSTNAEDVTAWGSEQTTTFGHNISYANPIELPDDSDACYVFCRLTNSPYKWSYKRTADYSTWGSQVDFWVPATGQAYLHCVRNGTGRIDFLASDAHPDNDPGIESNLYHFYCAWDSGSGSLKWYSSDGTEQTLPMTPAKATLVFDGTTAGNDGWNHQIDIDGSGHPRILYQQRVSTAGTGDNRLMFRKWTGSAWSTAVQVCALGGYVYSGELSYTGVGCFDGSNINKIYACVEVSGVYEAQVFDSADDGASWSKTADITSGSDTGAPNLRPFSPKGHDGSCALLWVSGSYTSWTSFAQDIHCHPPMRVDAHVKVPSVSDTTDTVLWCYYDNQAATDQAAPTSVWDSSFTAVHHMTPRPGTLGIRDSTSNAANSTRLSNLDPTDSDGGQSFDGTNDYLSTSGTALPLAGLTGLTIEKVFQYTGAGATGVYHTLVSNWNSSPTKASVLIVANPTVDGNSLRGFVLRQTNTQVGGTFGVTFAVNTPQYMAVAFDSTTVLVGQVNETEGGTTYSAGGAMDATAGDAIRYGDAAHNPGRRLAGAIYESRWSNVSRSTAWRSATSRTLRNPLGFLTLGAEESGGNAVAIEMASGTDTALALAAVQLLPIGRADEADAAIALSAIAASTVGIATQADTALPLPVIQLLPIGRADESDTALALSTGAASAVGTAPETDTALPLAAVQRLAVGLATESDTALLLDPSAPGTLGLAAEANTALTLAAVQTAPVGVAAESSQALALAAVRAITVGMALEIEVAFALGALQAQSVGRALEVDVALGLAGGDEVVVLVPSPRTPRGVDVQPMYLGVDCFPI
jgi:hypothetical protein